MTPPPTIRNPQSTIYTPPPVIITIDGPSGTGKSTLARLLAKRLGFLYLDTGAMYRAVGLKALRQGVSLTDRRALTALARGARIRFRKGRAGTVRTLLDGRDVTRLIRVPRVTEAASRVAVIPGVRRALVALQRAIGATASLVAEGRDTGTVVFPEAPLKIFLTASPAERARRRRADLRSQGHAVGLRRVLLDLRHRDHRDRRRLHSPLRPARGAVRIDNTRLQPAEVLDRLLDYVHQAHSRGNRGLG